MSFVDKVKAKVCANRKTIVLPESHDRRVIDAAAYVMEEGIADIVLIGNREEVTAMFPDVDLSKAAFMEPRESEHYDAMVDTYYELRKKKGMTKEGAETTMLQPTPFGVMLVKLGLADGLVAGAVNTTADTLRPALQILRTKPGTKLVSAFFLMAIPGSPYGEDGLLLMSDCALNVDPSAEELSDIAIASARTWQTLTGTEPRVALLSYSSHGSGKGEGPEKVAEATRLAKEKAPDLLIDGELQVDTALVSSVAQLKTPESVVAGRANCLIFPDLDSGNIGYKLVQRLAGADAYGPMLQGIAKPVNDLSRGCETSDIIGVITLTCLQAMEEA
ncbi:MAG TPA: phosphate acetyltransferase [Clostridiaceae bacterium]|jgi:phosphate acetyltransferase|nr:phosphate acetyltransferase [Clostridiaceae bacterium]